MSIGAWSFWLMFRPLQVVDSSLIFSIECNLFNIYKMPSFSFFLISSPAMSWAFERGWSGWIGRDWWALCHPARPFSFYPSLKIQIFHTFLDIFFIFNILCHPACPFSFYPSLKIKKIHTFFLIFSIFLLYPFLKIKSCHILPFSYCTNSWKYCFVKFSYFHIVLIPKV